MADEKTIEMSVYIRQQREAAILVEPVHSTRNSAWVPLSQVDTKPTMAIDIFTLTIPEWLATDKGLL